MAIRGAVSLVVAVMLVLGGCSSSGNASNASSSTNTSRSSTTNPNATVLSTPSTLDRATAGSVPVPTSKPTAAVSGDKPFCDRVNDVQQQLGRIDPTETTPAQRLAASQKAFAEVTAAAPAGIKADLEKVNTFVATASSIETLAAAPADLGPAMQQIVAWFSSHCGISLQLG